MTRRLLLLGLWLGVAYGLVEGAAIVTLSFVPGALSWRNANSASALWFAPLFYAAVMLVIAAIVAALAAAWRRPRWDAVLVFIAAGGGAYLLLRFPDLLWPWACALLGAGVGMQAARLYAPRADRLTSFAGRSLPWLGALVALLALAIAGGGRLHEQWTMRRLPDAPERAPNVILLVLDTQRADHLSAYGYPRPTTPFLARLASEGTLFERAYSHSSWTLPSHASMFTGRPLHEHKAGLMRMPYLDDAYPTIAEVMDRRGYATGGFVANRFWVGRQTGLARGFVHYDDMYTSLGDAFERTILGRLVTYEVIPHFEVESDLPGRRDAADVTHAMVDWIDGVHGRPFFAFANYFDMHAPFIAPAPVRGMFGWHPPTSASGEMFIGQLDAPGQLPPPEEIQRQQAGYDEALVFVDRQIQWLYEQLQQRGLLDNTVIIVTADHGESWGEHGEMLHGHSLWNNQIHVPLIVRYPPRFAPGTRVTHPVGNQDVAATIAALGGVEDAPFTTQTLMTAQGPDADDSVIVEVGRRAIASQRWPVARGWVAGVAAGPLLYLQEQHGRTELYDVVRDPAETNNLTSADSLDAECGALARRLQRLPLDTGLTNVRSWVVKLMGR